MRVNHRMLVALMALTALSAFSLDETRRTIERTGRLVGALAQRDADGLRDNVDRVQEEEDQLPMHSERLKGKHKHSSRRPAKKGAEDVGFDFAPLGPPLLLANQPVSSAPSSPPVSLLPSAPTLLSLMCALRN
jgi:hypothetical protein